MKRDIVINYSDKNELQIDEWCMSNKVQVIILQVRDELAWSRKNLQELWITELNRFLV